MVYLAWRKSLGTTYAHTNAMKDRSPIYGFLALALLATPLAAQSVAFVDSFECSNKADFATLDYGWAALLGSDPWQYYY